MSNKKANPPPPKRPLSTFFIYRAENYENLKKVNADLKGNEVLALMTKNYKGLSDKEMKKLNEKAEKLKEAYEQERKEYEEEYGPIPKQERKKVNVDKSVDKKKRGGSKSKDSKKIKKNKKK